MRKSSVIALRATSLRSRSFWTSGRVIAAPPNCAGSSSRISPKNSLGLTASRHFSNFPIQQESFPSSKDSPVPDSAIPILTSVGDYRAWRKLAAQDGKSVGFVATMGALHEGHLSLVQACLDENDHTVVSVFVNPAQFAPTEDLASYPRTLKSDVEKLAQLKSKCGRKRVAVTFVPTVSEMYPNGFTQVVDDQVGAFVEVKGLSHQMEGGSRPTFFRGVATVVTKLFHIIQPDRTYFGQKDIQQAILLRRLVQDLDFAHPPSASHLRVVPTGRDPTTKLALSSRNAYLTPASRQVAPILYKALLEGERTWQDPRWEDTPSSNEERIRLTLFNARSVVERQVERSRDAGIVNLKLDYISLNHPKSLEDLETALARDEDDDISLNDGIILSGAVLISEGKDGKVTRLIDNLLLGFSL